MSGAIQPIVPRNAKGPGRAGLGPILVAGLLGTIVPVAGGDTLAGQTAPSILRGTVVAYESGEPLQGAAVSLAAGPDGTPGIGTRVTDSNGFFRFDRVPSGTYRLRVTLLGYHDTLDTLAVAPGADLEISHVLSVSPIPLDPIVVVTESRDRGFLRGFEDRRQTRSGTFFDRQDIEARNPFVLTDLLRLVPGARVIPAGSRGNTVRLRGGCRPSLWVDGVPLMTLDGMDDFLLPMDIEAVEVYLGVSLPVQFGSNSCGAIVVWTRRGEPTQGTGSFWKKFAAGMALVFLAILTTG